MKKSFTLIELIVCLSIISILVLIVRVNFNNGNTVVAKEELNLISESILNAKIYSINTKKNVKVISDAKNETFSVVSDGLKFKVYKCSHLDITKSLTINFNANGIPSEGNTFEFSYKKKRFEIRVRPVTGYINIVEVE